MQHGMCLQILTSWVAILLQVKVSQLADSSHSDEFYMQHSSLGKANPEATLSAPAGSRGCSIQLAINEFLPGEGLHLISPCDPARYPMF